MKRKHIIIIVVAVIVGLLVGALIAASLIRHKKHRGASAMPPSRLTTVGQEDEPLGHYRYAGCYEANPVDSVLPATTGERMTVNKCFVAARDTGAIAFALQNGSVDGKGDCYYGTAEYMSHKHGSNCDATKNYSGHPLGSVSSAAVYKIVL